MSESKLFLLPNFLGEEQTVEQVFPPMIKEVIESLGGVVVENEKTARRLLLHFIDREKMQTMEMVTLNEHTKTSEKIALSAHIDASNKRWGLLSDAGVPCIADPGSDLVLLLKKRNVPIEAIVGPSSIFLALMLSGLPGQHFSFQGYLPQEEKQHQALLRQMEKNSYLENRTFLWMDTPYRTDKELEMAVKILSDDTYLCLAMNLLLPGQMVITERVSEWKKNIDSSEERKFGKVPAIFLLYCDRQVVRDQRNK